MRNKKPPDVWRGRFERFEKILIILWWDELVTNFDHATFDDLGNKTSSIEECFLEALFLTAEIIWTSARIAVFHSAKTCIPDLKLFVDKLHELNSFDKDVSATFLKFESASFEQNDVHEGDLAFANFALVVTTFAGRITVTLQALARKSFHFCDFLHLHTSLRADTNCFDDSIHNSIFFV